VLVGEEAGELQSPWPKGLAVLWSGHFTKIVGHLGGFGAFGGEERPPYTSYPPDCSRPRLLEAVVVATVRIVTTAWGILSCVFAIGFGVESHAALVVVLEGIGTG
jgi:hypothetical protein